MNHRLLIVIVGPNASGKSALAVRLAKKFKGEVVSADSRQVYKGLDIGAGKISKREMKGVPHHLLNVASPKRRFSVIQYQRRAIQAIADIKRRNKLPILVGGTPFYVYAVVDNLQFPKVKPNPKLRGCLARLSNQGLFAQLKKLDPVRAASIEKDNPRRLVRALEIVLATRKPVPKLKKTPLPYPVLFLGVKRTPEELKKKIASRLAKRLRQGMIAEVRKLHASGLSWKRLEELGLEYRFVAQYLQGKLSREKMREKLQRAIEDFARRQMTWFKKDGRIRWISAYPEALRLVNTCLGKSDANISTNNSQRK